MNKHTNLADLFNDWHKKHKNEPDAEYNLYKNGNVDKESFCRDGIINESAYSSADKKILFIAKEGNEGRGSNSTNVNINCDFWLQGVANGVYGTTYFARRLAILANAYHNDEYTNPNNDIKILNKCAFMNLNKRGGYSRCSWNTLEHYTEKYACFIRNEIAIIAPKLIVCCGKNLKALLEDNKLIPDLPESAKTIEVYHPSYFVISNKRYIEALGNVLK